MSNVLPVPVKCPVQGFEQVTVQYNMLASEADWDALVSSYGGRGVDACIVAVEGWDAETYGDDPWGRDAPLAFRAWASRTGFTTALGKFTRNPDFWTASTPSTPPTVEAR